MPIKDGILQLEVGMNLMKLLFTIQHYKEKHNA